MIKVDPCRGCGRMIVEHRVANLNVRLEVEALDAQQCITALTAGRGLWRFRLPATFTPVRNDVLAALATAPPGDRPHVMVEHRCAVSGGAPFDPPSTGETGPPPESRQSPPERLTQSVAVDLWATTPSARPATASPEAGARSAEPPRSEVDCSVCGRPCDDVDNRVIFQLGATRIDTFHTDCAIAA